MWKFWSGRGTCHPVEDLFDVGQVFCTGTAEVVSPAVSITYKDKR